MTPIQSNTWFTNLAKKHQKCIFGLFLSLCRPASTHFYDYDVLQPKITPPKHFSRQCIHDNFLINSGKYIMVIVNIFATIHDFTTSRNLWILEMKLCIGQNNQLRFFIPKEKPSNSKYFKTKGISIQGEVRHVGISRATQQLLCSKSHAFLAIFALAHSKINQIA